MARKTKFKRIFAHFKNDILTGVFSEGNLISSEKEVCEQFNVSRITARAALKLLEAEDLVEAVPNRGRRVIFPRTAIRRQKQAIAVFGLANAYTQRCFSGVNAFFEPAFAISRFLPITEFGGHSDFLREIDAALMQDAYAGIILISNVPLSEPQTEHLNGLGLPWLQAGLEGLVDYDTVCTDNALGAEILVDYLVSLGHERITYFHYWKMDRLPTFRIRQAGYIRAMLKHNLKPDYTGFQRGQHIGFQEIEKDFEKMFHLGTREQTSCIMTVTSSFSIQIGQQLLRMGYRIPEDISLCGFGKDFADEEILPFNFHVLTNTEEPMDQVGKAAAQRLLQMINEECDLVQQIKINPQLLDGDSVARLA